MIMAGEGVHQLLLSTAACAGVGEGQRGVRGVLAHACAIMCMHSNRHMDVRLWQM